MLQRIQTIYLLLVSFLNALLLFMPLATVQLNGDFYSFDIAGVQSMNGESELIPTWGLLILSVSISLIAFVTVFLYKKRMLQIRMSVFNAILMISFYGLFAYLVWVMKGQVEGIIISLKFAASFPLVALILDYLAIRNIGADETLIRSLNRLR